MTQVIIPGVPFPDKIPFRQARDFYGARRDPRTGKPCEIRNIVIHTAEIGESLEGAEALMSACAVGRPPKPDGSANLASWHFAVDANSITQSVRDEHTAWHAPGLSHCSIGIELSGRARQNSHEWRDDFSERMLELAAQLVARLCTKHDVPITRCDDTALRYGLKGICGHADVSAAFRRSTHWDPGPSFPWAQFLSRVESYSLHAKTDPAPPPAESIAPPINPDTLPTLETGPKNAATEQYVRLLQERLNATGTVPPLVVDGHFGWKTDEAVRVFQRSHLLVVDGVVGRKTWTEVLREVK
jgi:hypothetical protein